MKKTFLPLLLGALMVSCAANDPLMSDQNEGNQDANEAQGFLAVNLVAPGGLNTRAANDQYEYGTELENYVECVRLYFFNENESGQLVGTKIRKNPAYLNAEQTPSDPEWFSYYDWYPTPAENELPDGYESGDSFTGNPDGSASNGTIEKIVSAMVSITAKDAVFPTQLVAIINPTEEIKNITLQNPLCSLSDLQEGGVFNNLKDPLNNNAELTNKNFVMSSSVYINEGGQIVITQPISNNPVTDPVNPGNLGFTQKEAAQNPVNVFVERVLARLDMSLDGLESQKNDQGVYTTQTEVTTEDRVYNQDIPAPDGQLDDETIYVNFLGWAITSTPTKSNVIKSINADWGPADNLFGVINQPWYVPSYHRSFWATNPELDRTPTTGGDYEWFSFAELSGEDGQEHDAQNPAPVQIGHPMDYDLPTYMQENANPYPGTEADDPIEPTKVIFAAQLVHEDGSPLEVAMWNGVYFTLQGLKNLAAKMLDMYYYDEDTQKYIKITGDQITFMTASQFFNTEPIFSDTPNYTVYACLTNDADADDQVNGNAAKLTWYHLNDNINPDKATADQFTKLNPNSIPNYMQQVFGDAQVWHNGYTYYYYTIRHFGDTDKPGFYGVVRNHIYQGTVNNLTGLGTPVWDPDEKIYPEKPSDHGTNLSVAIKVLAWRLVSDGYEFDW